MCWVFVSVRGLSPVAESGGHSLSRPLPLRSTGSRRAGSVVVAHGLSCSAACGIFPDQGSNLRPLHWQADSQPLRHQGSPGVLTLRKLQFLATAPSCPSSSLSSPLLTLSPGLQVLGASPDPTVRDRPLGRFPHGARSRVWSWVSLCGCLLHANCSAVISAACLIKYIL